MKKLISITLYFIVTILFNSCSQTITKTSDIGLNDGKYDRGFFQIEKNNKLDRLVNSVKMINCFAYYQSYLFEENSVIRKADLERIDLNELATAKTHTTETASGTATIVYLDNDKIALLTSAHILDFPDTLISYFNNSDIIESISIKVRQSNILPEFTSSKQVEILSINSIADIAIVGGIISSRIASRLIPFKLKRGNSKELSWGAMVYIIGYPLNNKMITSGLVSPPQISDKDYFFVDAVFNRGFSGGIVLAVRDGAPNFEFVGMVKSGTVERGFRVVPNSDSPDFNYLPKVPFAGETFIEEELNMKYGVTKIMTVEKVTEFIDNSKPILLEKGYDPERFFQSEDEVKTDVQN